jgi:hypothetical protein
MPENLVNAAVTVTLDGRELVLRYKALAFIRYAEETEGDLLSDIRDLGALGEGIKAGGAGAGKLFGKVRDVLWAGLLHVQPDITRDDAARLFGLDDLPALMPAIVKALTGTLPVSPPGAEPRPTKAPSRRRDGRSIDGSGSGPSSATDAELQQQSSAV